MSRIGDAARRGLQLNGLLALGAGSIVASAATLTRAPVPLDGVVVAMLSVFAVYNFDRIADTTEGDGTTSPQRTRTVRRLQEPLKVAIAAATVVALVVGAAAGSVALAWTLAFPVAGLLYVVPLVGGRRLKDIPGLKSVYVPGCWCIFVAHAVVFGDFEVNAAVLAFAGFVFARLFVSSAMGGIRDLREDRAAGVATLAVLLGSRRLVCLLEAWQLATIVGWCAAVATGIVSVGALWMLGPVVVAHACFRRFLARPRDSELLLELYDLEFIGVALVVALAA